MSGGPSAREAGRPGTLLCGEGRALSRRAPRPSARRAPLLTPPLAGSSLACPLHRFAVSPPSPPPPATPAAATTPRTRRRSRCRCRCCPSCRCGGWAERGPGLLGLRRRRLGCWTGGGLLWRCCGQRQAGGALSGPDAGPRQRRPPLAAARPPPPPPHPHPPPGPLPSAHALLLSSRPALAHPRLYPTLAPAPRQNHFPERLGKAVCYRPPTLFNLAWKAISPFVDPHTREKLVFLSPSTKPGEREGRAPLRACGAGACLGLVRGAGPSGLRQAGWLLRSVLLSLGPCFRRPPPRRAHAACLPVLAAALAAVVVAAVAAMRGSAAGPSSARREVVRPLPWPPQRS